MLSTYLILLQLIHTSVNVPILPTPLTTQYEASNTKNAPVKTIVTTSSIIEANTTDVIIPSKSIVNFGVLSTVSTDKSTHNAIHYTRSVSNNVSSTPSINDQQNTAQNSTLAPPIISECKTGTLILELDKNNNSKSVCKTKISRPYHFYSYIGIGSVSLLTLLVNFFLLAKICSCDKATVIDCFGLSLMVFNVLLALYGIGLATYLSQEQWVWHQTFCQGLTSIKLFALGASVWTMVLLTYHHGIRTSISTGEERDAIFKGIVYILEGLMLSGVFAVMSWIKLDKFEYLCIIWTPKTTVEWMLTGIELWYYCIALLLIIRYPIHRFRKTKRVADARYINQAHPVFIMIFTCFVFWVSGYVITLPMYKWFSLEIKSVIRISSLIFPLTLQAIIYAIRNTCICTCRDRPCSSKNKKKKINSKLSAEDHSVLLVCNCSGSETCPACESEFETRTKYGDTRFSEKESNGKANSKKLDSDKKINETEKVSKRNKKRKNKVASPKVVCRSPIVRQRNSVSSPIHDPDEALAETPLLKKQEPKLESGISQPAPNTLDLSTDSTPLLDDTDGTGKPPKADPETTPSKIFKKVESVDSPSVRPTEFPSFINMDSAVDVDSLPKEKRTTNLSSFSQKDNNETGEGRTSRGPTFYPLDEKTQEKKKKVKRKDDAILEEGKPPSKKDKKGKETGLRKRKRKAKPEQNEMDYNSAIHPKRDSSISLEWDHTYSYSDSSGSQESDSFKVDKLQSPLDPVNKKLPAINLPSTDRVTNDKDHAMEWDPSGCQIKASPEISSSNRTCDWEPYSVTESKPLGGNSIPNDITIQINSKNISPEKKTGDEITTNHLEKHFPSVSNKNSKKLNGNITGSVSETAKPEIA